MEPPLQKIIDWYKSLPVDQKVDVGAMIGMHAPGFEDIDFSTDTDLVPDKFLKTLESCTSSRHQEVGMVLNLRANIEFFFINKHSSKPGWKNTERIMKELAATKDSDTFRDAADRVEFRGRQWISSCERWEEIKPYLSDEYLDEYFILG